MGSLGSINKKIRNSSGWNSYSSLSVTPVVGWINNYQNYIEYKIPVNYNTGEYISSLSISYQLWSTQGSGRTVTAYAYLFGTDFTGQSISGYVKQLSQVVYGVTTANAQVASFTFSESDLSTICNNQYIYILVASDSANVQSYTAAQDNAQGPTITASFMTNYTISYDANGGSTTPASQTKKQNVSISLASAISRADTVNRYTLTPNANGGTLTDSNTGTCTKTTSYAFNGWFSSADSKTYQAGATYSANASSVMKAQWEVSSTNYSTSISNIGDPTKSGNLTYCIVKYNYNHDAIPEVSLISTRDCTNRFAGWYTAASGGNLVQANTQFNSNSTIYAHWDDTTWTGNPTSVTLPVPPARTGYTFLGYSTSPTATSASQSAGTYTPPSGAGGTTITFYAVWRANVYQVTFNPNTGTVDTHTKDVSYGSEYGTLPVPTKSGYGFLGWFTSASGGSIISSDTIVEIAQDHTLYAHWGAQYSYRLEFNINGGTGTVPATIEAIDHTDQTYIATWDPSSVSITKPNSEWIGWSTTPRGEPLEGGINLSAYEMSNSTVGTLVTRTLYAVYDTNGAVTLFNGSAFVKALVYVHDGIQWRLCIPYVNNGVEWKVGE